MKNLVLVQKDGACFFSDPKKGSENEVFTDKLSGVNILTEYALNNFITKCHALELLQQVISLREFPIGPVDSDDQIQSDMDALIKIASQRSILRRMSLSESEENLPKFKVCSNCKNHGAFIGKEFVTGDFTNKKEALICIEKLFDTGAVNRDQRKKLEAEVEKSGLPERSAAESAVKN